MPAPHANLAVGKIANNPGNAGTAIKLETGQGDRFAQTTGGSYPAFIFPEGQLPTPTNCEIVEVTNRAGDTFTVTRKSEAGSGSLNVASGMLMMAGATVKTFTDIETSITVEVARAIESETELANLLSEAQTNNASLEARVAVIEARLGGLSGTGKPVVTSLPLIGAAPSPESMIVKGEVNPNGATTEWWVEWGETEALGNVSSHVTGLTGTTAQAVEKTLTSPTPGLLTAALFFRVVAKNSNGETRGAIMQPSPTITERPTASYATSPVTNISTAGFTGNAVVNPNGEATTITLEWGTTTGYGTTKVFGETPSDRLPHNVAVAATGLSLTAGTTYHYRIKAVNGKGTTNLADGTFTVGTTNETLLGEPSTPAGGNECKDSKGRVESIPFTVAKTGTLKEIKFNKSKVSDGGTISEVRVAVSADDGTGKPVAGAVLKEGHKTVGEEALIATTGTITIPLESTLAVNAGEKLWLQILPIGGRIYTPAAAAGPGGTQQWQSKSPTEYNEINKVSGWENEGSRAQGPCQIWGVGTTTTVSNVPSLKEASNHEEVEWSAIGSETEYELRISKQPSTVSGRIAAIFTQAKTANPQKFKPKANTTYGTSPQVVITPGSTAYVEVRVAGTTEWSNGVGIVLAGEAVTVLKGIEMGGWGASEELGDMEESKQNVIRLNKPSPERTKELEAKGIKVVYLYAYDVGGQNKSGVKAINRTAWVADAIKRIKEAKPAYFECLNEPGGSWFWGGEAGNAAEAEAYVNLLKLLWEEVQAKISAGERPKIIASLDGGKSTSKEYVEKLKAANASFTNYFDYGSCHAYYKSGGNATGKLGNRGNVLAIYSYIGKVRKIAVTEIGWPTLKETGDSYKYNEAEQAEAVGGWLAWTKSAESETAVVLTTIYGYRDGSGEPPGYGLWHLDDSPKAAVAKVASA